MSNSEYDQQLKVEKLKLEIDKKLKSIKNPNVEKLKEFIIILNHLMV